MAGYSPQGHEGSGRTERLTLSMDMNSGKFRETVEVRGARSAVVHGCAESDTTEQANNNEIQGYGNPQKGVCVMATVCQKHPQPGPLLLC